ncbi:MAG: FkbM family methyltransferase [Planctomycetales bacterium]|nr:FkbM family methyltransferase [Planctomycetales bacterium]
MSLSKMRNVLHRIGFDFHRYPATRMTVIRRRGLLQSMGIKTFLDVGANTGEFAQEVRADGFKGSIISFEPLSEAFKQLSQRADGDPQWTCLNCAIGSETGTATINVAGNSVSSSLLPMASLHSDSAPDSAITRSEEIQVKRLSDLCEQLKTEFPAYLKIDTQGFELEVLKSAQTLLSQIPAIELEMSISELYEGQPLFPEVHNYLEGQGYYLHSIEEGFVDRRMDRILQIECIYIHGNRDLV